MSKKKSLTTVLHNAWILLLAGTIACNPSTRNSQAAEEKSPDLLETIYTIADKKGMKVISDINVSGGDLYGKLDPGIITDSMKQYIKLYSRRYGQHKSFWGWYLNHEINPIKVADNTQTAFWEEVWKTAVDACHQAKPGSVVTVSPFFLLDKQALRGFEYLQPEEYENWWTLILNKTGIDILMLQDSGAEHLGFFTMDERRPFFQAFKNACQKAGSQFWLNVETGEVNAQNWKEAIEMERNHQRKWVFTPIEHLKQKLNLAAEYTGNMINWGYFPLMNPIQEQGPWPSGEVDGQEISFEGQQKAYTDYKTYYEQIKGNPNAPHIRGTLWMLRENYEDWSQAALTETLTRQIDAQKALGFDMLWIINTPQHANF